MDNDHQTRESRGSFSCVTLVSLPVEIDPNLGDHTQTRNAENPNKNGHKGTRLDLRERLRQDCKPLFIGSIPIAASNHLNPFDSLQVPPRLCFFVCFTRVSLSCGLLSSDDPNWADTSTLIFLLLVGHSSQLLAEFILIPA